MPTFAHFEIPADNVERARKFYEKLFDWKTVRWDGTTQEYYLVTTEGQKGQHALNGGIIKRQNAGHPFMCYVDVEDIDAYLKKVVKCGGKIALPKQTIPNVGHYAAFIDPEGNIIGLHQDLTMQKKK